jgi:WhiB family redox-sensing transcriptional regulator
MGEFGNVTHHATYVDLHTRMSTLEELPEPEPWVGDALCAQTDPDIFFPEKGGSTLSAKQVCASCPVREECLDYALRMDERFGIWGGTSERQRRKLSARRVDGRLPDDVWTQRKAAVTRLHAEGLLDAEIGERLGFSAETAGRLRRGLGLSRHRLPKPGGGRSDA